MTTSIYQNLKLHILSFCHLSKDAAHIYIGLLTLFIWVLLSRKPLGSLKSVIPVLMVAVTMEFLDLRDDLNSLGHMRWGASFHDIINTIFWPVVIVFIFKLGLIKSAIKT